MSIRRSVEVGFELEEWGWLEVREEEREEGIEEREGMEEEERESERDEDEDQKPPPPWPRRRR